jgi:hypothetical protein
VKHELTIQSEFVKTAIANGIIQKIKGWMSEHAEITPDMFNWWQSLSYKKKQDYLRKHPHSRFNKLRIASGGWKQFFNKLWDGTQIYIVDGNFVRSKLFVDFVLGGHGYIYLFIPKNEIWIERTISQNDMKNNLTHEIIEYIFMKYLNYSYNRAHDITANVERVLRIYPIRRTSPTSRQTTDVKNYQ